MNNSVEKNKDREFIFVIFGASGDLTRRKLIPAIYHLYLGGHLKNRKFHILGVSRTSMSDEEFQNKVTDTEYIDKEKKYAQKLKSFKGHISYLSINTSDPDEYSLVKNELDDLCNHLGYPGNFIFYLSTPPSLFEKIADGLSRNHLNEEKDGSFRRLIIEKPFGYDLKSSRKLNEDLHTCFREDQIYRIDHYLGKETVQNLLVTRFSNSIFEPLWNRNFIHNVEITAAESDGVGSRGGYYDSSGALRDMVQNHLFNLLTIVAMEPPVSLHASDIRDETQKVFKSVRRFSRKDIAQNIVRGQYTAAHIQQKEIKGYRQEKGVDPDSQNETYVALKLFIDNWRWAGVPFYIRTGKRLPMRVTEIVIHFKSTPHFLFKKTDCQDDQDNILVFRIQPNEGILLKFGIKTPGTGFNIKSVNMDFHYADHSDMYIPEAYERLLLDAVHGDATLYPRSDSVEEAWKLVDPILTEWKNNSDMKIYGYPAGSWGPAEADRLFKKNVLKWRNPCDSFSNNGFTGEL